mmetsp:Transcript_20220/g.28357  ORF Transcript_20220/g.28357 Transcript_20220/m.28357 type:complete len:237 (+) Transcript_20220:94-804(+)
MQSRNEYFYRDINWSALKHTHSITPEIQNHLVNVYTTLAATILCAAVGSLVFLKTLFGGGLTFLVGFMLLFWLAITPKEEVSKRLGILFAFSFVEGLSIGPLLLSVAAVDPAIITQAFLGTVCIFGCFSASAYFAERRSYLFLGGMLGSALTSMIVLGFLNIFLGSAFLFNGLLYLGLLVFCGFVIFDTQLIIEKAGSGRKDFVQDALELFLDFVNIFVRLLIILAKDKKKNNNRK